MRVDHRGLDVVVAEQFLHRANVVTSLQEMSRERMPERMARCPLAKPSLNNSHVYRSLNHGLVDVMPVESARHTVPKRSFRRKHPLPRPCTLGRRLLPRERSGRGKGHQDRLEPAPYGLTLRAGAGAHGRQPGRLPRGRPEVRPPAARGNLGLPRSRASENRQDADVSRKASAAASCGGSGAARRRRRPAAPCGCARRPRSCPRTRARSRRPRRR